MPTRPTRRDHDPAYPRQLFVRKRDPTQTCIASLLQQPSTHDVAYALGLFADLLQHEMFVATFLSGLEIPFDLMDGALYVALFDVEDAVALSRQDSAIAIIEVYDLFRVLNHRGCVRAHQVLTILADPDEERAPLSGNHDLARIAAAHDRESVRTLDLSECCENGILQGGILLEGLVDQMDDGLRIGLGLEDVSEIRELGPNDFGVLDNTVVNQRDVSPLAPVWMSVQSVRGSVSRPAGVGDPAGTRRHTLIEDTLQLGDLTRFLHRT